LLAGLKKFFKKNSLKIPSRFRQDCTYFFHLNLKVKKITAATEFELTDLGLKTKRSIHWAIIFLLK